jgi:hypothetical protein
MTPSDVQPADERRIPEAEQPPTAEEELAGGRAADTPAALISWVFVAIAVPAAIAVVIAVLVYVLG